MNERVLALGDSYTIGQGVTAAERWPAQLTRLLRDRGVRLQEPEIIAATGWTTGELLSALEATAPSGPFVLVSLLAGVNDQYRGSRADDYRHRFVELLRRAVTLAGGDAGRVLVLSIPDWGATPFGARDRRGPSRISASIARFNLVNRRASMVAGTHYVDVTARTRHAARNPAMLLDDQLHPAAAIYAEWATLVLPAALAALGLSGSTTPPGARG